MGSGHQFESFDNSKFCQNSAAVGVACGIFLAWVGVVWGCALSGSGWIKFGGWLLCSQPLDAAVLRRVALFIPLGHCWKRQWLRCIIRILVVDAGDTQRI